jgi:CelD/BcsL family acetyltransferase involved in cellulose biosynthesis
MKITSLPPRQLTPNLVSRWHDILLATPQLAGPFFRPEFIAAVAEERAGVEVAVFEDAGRVVGFFPFERNRWNVAQPVAGRLSDYQGVIAPADVPWNPDEIMSALRLAAWEFDHQLASQTPLAPHFVTRGPSPVIDLSRGYDHWLASRKAERQAVKELVRKGRKLERESTEIDFTWHTSDTGAFRQLLAWKSAQYVRTGVPNIFRERWTLALLDRIRHLPGPNLQGVLSTLRADGRLLAVHFGMQAGDTLHWWFPTYDPEQARCSPGQVLLLKIAAAAAAHGVTRIDLGKGSEDYKLALASTSVEIAEGSIDRRPFAATVRRGWTATRDWVKRSPLGTPARSTLRWLRNLGERLGETALSAATTSSRAAASEHVRRTS